MTEMSEIQEQVAAYARAGASELEVADVLRMPIEQFREEHGVVFKQAFALMKIRLRARQIQLANEGDRALLIHLGKLYLEKKEGLTQSSIPPGPTEEELNNDLMLKWS